MKISRLLFLLSVFAALSLLLLNLMNGIWDTRFKISVLDVGQGDAILVHFPTGENMLIDGGPDEKVLTELHDILPLYEKKIDVIVLTHPHADHINGLIDVLKHYDIQSVILTGVYYNSPMYDEFLDAISNEGVDVHFAHADIDFQMGGTFIDIVYPLRLAQGDRSENLNNSSVSFRFITSSGVVYFSGDLEKEGELELLKSGQDLSADILKAGHHGSRTSSSVEFLEKVTPEIALISCGRDNSFKHPHPETLRHFSEFGVEVFRTDMDGRIELVGAASSGDIRGGGGSGDSKAELGVFGGSEQLGVLARSKRAGYSVTTKFGTHSKK